MNKVVAELQHIDNVSSTDLVTSLGCFNADCAERMALSRARTRMTSVVTDLYRFRVSRVTLSCWLSNSSLALSAVAFAWRTRERVSPPVYKGTVSCSPDGLFGGVGAKEILSAGDAVAWSPWRQRCKCPERLARMSRRAALSWALAN